MLHNGPVSLAAEDLPIAHGTDKKRPSGRKPIPAGGPFVRAYGSTEPSIEHARIRFARNHTVSPVANVGATVGPGASNIVDVPARCQFEERILAGGDRTRGHTADGGELLRGPNSEGGE